MVPFHDCTVCSPMLKQQLLPSNFELLVVTSISKRAETSQDILSPFLNLHGGKINSCPLLWDPLMMPDGLVLILKGEGRGDALPARG